MTDPTFMRLREQVELRRGDAAYLHDADFYLYVAEVLDEYERLLGALDALSRYPMPHYMPDDQRRKIRDTLADCNRREEPKG